MPIKQGWGGGGGGCIINWGVAKFSKINKRGVGGGGGGICGLGCSSGMFYLKMISSSIRLKCYPLFFFHVAGLLKLNIMTKYKEIQSVEKEIQAGQWHHVIIESKVEGGGTKLYVYVNMVSVDRTISSDKGNLVIPVEVDFFLGKTVDDKIEDAFKNAEISIDNLAIWKRTLNKKEKTKIYLVEFGEFFRLLNCFIY